MNGNERISYEIMNIADKLKQVDDAQLLVCALVEQYGTARMSLNAFSATLYA